MQQFLDKTGFVRAWQHIKSYIDRKTEDDIETGETLVDMDGVIDVKTPVNGVISQKDFDALSPEEQEHGLWVIPGTGGGSGGAAQEIYSTEETQIGTWIDGRPLYRKVITGTSKNTTSWEKYERIEDLDVLINSFGFFELNYNATCKYSSVPCANVEIGASNDHYISMYIGNATYKGKPFRIAVEYTKTTDEGSTT